MDNNKIIKYWFIFLICLTIFGSTITKILQDKMLAEKE